MKKHHILIFILFILFTFNGIYSTSNLLSNKEVYSEDKIIEKKYLDLGIIYYITYNLVLFLYFSASVIYGKKLFFNDNEILNTNT